MLAGKLTFWVYKHCGQCKVQISRHSTLLGAGKGSSSSRQSFLLSRRIGSEVVMAVGYDPDFLQLEEPLPLPSPSEDLLPHIYKKDGQVMEMKHLHWSAIMDTREERRCAAVVGLNIDGSKFWSAKGSRSWDCDYQQDNPEKNQLDNSYYYRNEWDRGHLARRASAAWGDTFEEAREASDDTYYWTNCSLQHSDFNQDEWLELENKVKINATQEAVRVSVFSGPIFFKDAPPNWVHPRGTSEPPARVPSAYFKVICARPQGPLAVWAFVMSQEEYRDEKGTDPVVFSMLQCYQVTVNQIEEITGLQFSEEIRKANPLYYSDQHSPEEVRNQCRVTRLPEIIPIDRPEDIVDKEDIRPVVSIGESGVRIAAALVNPEGSDERGREWISVRNTGEEAQSLDGWFIQAGQSPKLALDGVLEAGETRQFRDENVVLSNKQGYIRLLDGERVVDRVKYSKSDVREAGQGVEVVFLKS